ncbi:hypothetical protein CYMTET_18320, partial [Cymbomonas tetramitiformis]
MAISDPDTRQRYHEFLKSLATSSIETLCYDGSENLTASFAWPRDLKQALYCERLTTFLELWKKGAIQPSNVDDLLWRSSIVTGIRKELQSREVYNVDQLKATAKLLTQILSSVAQPVQTDARLDAVPELAEEESASDVGKFLEDCVQLVMSFFLTFRASKAEDILAVLNTPDAEVVHAALRYVHWSCFLCPMWLRLAGEDRISAITNDAMEILTKYLLPVLKELIHHANNARGDDCMKVAAITKQAQRAFMPIAKDAFAFLL